MGAGRYEVVVRGSTDEEHEVRRWTAEEIASALPWLKRANAQGRAVLIRPAPGEEAGLLLVRGLDAARIDAMTAAGREPAVVVENAPGQLQAWVRVPACDAARREEVGRQLAEEQGVDPGGAVPGLFGRLAGFTNRQAGDERRQPWVLCRASSGRAASAGPELVEVAGQRLAVRAQEQQRARAKEQERARTRGYSRGDGGMEL